MDGNAKKKAKPLPTCDPALWPRCKFWMASKGRFCNMGPSPGALYCGVHIPEVRAAGAAPMPPTADSSSKQGHGAVSAKNRIGALPCAAAAGDAAALPADAATAAPDPMTPRSDCSDSKRRKGRDWREYGARVPCPHDPRHTVYERDLARHILTCPRFKQAQLEMQQPYYRKNINVPAAAPSPSDTLAAEDAAAEDDAAAAEEREERMRAGEIDPRRATPAPASPTASQTHTPWPLPLLRRSAAACAS
jgi:hypothetical protein